MIQMIMRFHTLEPSVALSELGMTRICNRCAQALLPISRDSCLVSTFQLPDYIAFIINWSKALILLPSPDHSTQITLLHTYSLMA